MSRGKKKIKICTGPGCKAWKSEMISGHLAGMEDTIREQGYEVHYVSCLNKCGGGACVQFNPGKRLFKLREPQEANSVIPMELGVAAAVA